MTAEGAIGWGIVGCGDVADRKAGGAFNAVANSRLVAVMRRNEDAAKAFAARHGAALATRDADAVIHHPDVDIVYVATPPANHLEYALAVAAAGKACLVEKPAGRSLEELNRMREAFADAGAPLFVSYYRRHLPRYRKVAELLDAGAIGNVVSIDYRLAKKPKNRGWSHDPAVSGGGSFYDIAGHMLDVFDGWFGPLEYLGGAAVSVREDHVAEDAVALSFRTGRGAVGTATWNFAATASRDELVIEGTQARLVMGGTSVAAPVRLERRGRSGPLSKVGRRLGRSGPLSKVGRRLGLAGDETFRFDKPAFPHQPLIADITAQLAAGASDSANVEAAGRTASIVDRVLTTYYGPREGAFWEHPERWPGRGAAD